MGVKASKQVQISIANDHKLDLLRYLQTSELAQIIENPHAAHLEPEYLEAKEELLEQLDEVNKALDILDHYQPVKSGLLDGLFDNRIKLSDKEFVTLSKNQDKFLDAAVDLYQKAERKETLDQRNRVLADVITKSEPLKDIEVDIFGEFKFVSFIPFMVDAERAHHVVDQITKVFDEAVVESLKKVGDEYVYVAAVRKSQEKEASDVISSQATVLTFQNEVSGSFYDMYTMAVEESKNNTKEIAEIEHAIATSKVDRTDLYALKDVIQSHIQILNGLHAFHTETDSRSYLKVWIDEENISSLKRVVSRKFDGSDVIVFDTYSDEAPIIMKNTGIIAQFETVTRIMGLPKGNSIDPTPLVAIFFGFMFGLGFSEAGYALLLLAISGGLLLSPKLKQGVRRLMSVIFLSSIVTLIVGALFGSWFGVVPEDVVASEALPHMQFLINIGVIPFLQQLQVMNPLDSVVALMGFTVALGIIHILIGLILGFVQEASRGNALGGALDSLSWLGFIVFGGVVVGAQAGLLGEGVSLIAEPLTIGFYAYVVLMIFALGRKAGNVFAMLGKGAYDMFFGAIGYLSDALSYTRLVALGLATGIIAGVIGTLARLAGEGLVEQGGAALILGYLLMATIFVVGHIFNIALNVLGTYINVGRLHFVEFFSKFFESGGVELEPMSRSQEYIRIEKN